MIDMFAELEEQPQLYIADVEVTASYVVRKGSKKVEKSIIKLEKVPIVLLDGKMPTRKSELRFFYNIKKNLKKVKYKEEDMKITKIENCKFSSKLAYTFDYSTN